VSPIEKADDHVNTRGRRVLTAALVGGAAAGALDLIYAFVMFGARGVSPMRILQSIASGVLGPAAREGGAETAALGAVLHFAMTFAMALTFALGYLLLPWLRRGTASWGLAYGAGLFVVMNYIVVPLSNAPQALSKPPMEVYLAGLVVHILLVGLPIALIAHAYLGPPVAGRQK
jgi:hypothetical protein